MTGPDRLAPLLDALEAALRDQREALEQGRLEGLAEINRELELRYEAVEGWPGGIAALHAEIAARPQDEGARLRERIRALAVDNRVCGDLIRVAMQRAAALRSFRAAASEAATYAPGSPAADGPGTRLSTRA